MFICLIDSAKRFSKVFLPTYYNAWELQLFYISIALNIFHLLIAAFLMCDHRGLELCSNTYWETLDPGLDNFSCKWCIWISHPTLVYSIFFVIENKLIFFRNLPSKPTLPINKGFEKQLRGQFFNSITLSKTEIWRTYFFK